ncbi:hypothetical protein [Hungatella effluvii]|uniref:hypothetical protein n=2 Tax=Lachnospiraceae TaxID=186803 RepID=UPI001F59646D|nr:hypothetical protein [Hungatella effluvii]
MATQKIELGKDTLANIYMMVPLLDEVGRKQACSYMFGLVSGSTRAELEEKGRKQKTN